MSQHVLLITCPDETGLIHRITRPLYHHGLNIVENDEFVDRGASTFHMRTVISGPIDADRLVAELREELPAGADVQLRAQAPRRLLLFGTREPHCVGDLLQRQASGELNAEIVGVVSQYDSLAPLVARFDLPYHHVPAEGLSREEHEGAMLEVVRQYEPDYLVLAKYMRILTPGFVGHFRNRIVNIHHSFLPAFIGSNPYRQAWERGVKIIGATAHFVNEDLDEGPIITQSVIPVNHTQDAAQMAKAGKDIERIVLARALNLVLDDRVIVQGRRTLVFE